MGVYRGVNRNKTTADSCSGPILDKTNTLRPTLFCLTSHAFSFTNFSLSFDYDKEFRFVFKR